MPAGITDYIDRYTQFPSAEQATVTASTKFWKDLQDLFPEECDQIYFDIIIPIAIKTTGKFSQLD